MSISIRLKFVLTLFVILIATGARSADPIYFDPLSEQSLYIWPMCSYLEDKEASLTIQDILTPQQQDKFTSTSSVSSTFGFTSSAIWIKFSVSTRDYTQPLYLLIERVSLWNADLFTVDSTQIFRIDALGANIPFHNRPVLSDYCVSRLLLDAKKPDRTFYLRLKTSTSMFMPMYLTSSSALAQKLSSVNLFNGIYAGILLLILLYNLIQYFLQKNAIYLWYLFYASSLFLYMGLCNTGLGFQYIWPNIPELNQHYTISKCLLGLSMLTFSAVFLDTRKNIPALHKPLWIFAGIYVIFIGMNLSGFIDEASKYFFWIFIASSVYLLAIGIVSYRRGNLNARLYLAGWGILIVSYIVFSLWLNGFIGDSFLARRALIIGSLLEMLFWFSAISDKIMHDRTERNEEEKRLRKEISRDFHDLLGNQAARMINYISLLRVRGQMGNTNYDALNAYAQNILEGAKDFVWALDPTNDEINHVLIHLKEFGERMFNEKDINFSFYNEVNHPITIPMGYSRQINLVFKEAMTNAFKHSKAKSVSLKVAINEAGQITIQLRDDGVGISEEQIRKSESGVSNMFYRARKIGCQLNLKSEKNTCTLVELIIPELSGRMQVQ
jgi:signal transduction histidine kinase